MHTHTSNNIECFDKTILTSFQAHLYRAWGVAEISVMWQASCQSSNWLTGGRDPFTGNSLEAYQWTLRQQHSPCRLVGTADTRVKWRYAHWCHAFKSIGTVIAWPTGIKILHSRQIRMLSDMLYYLMTKIASWGVRKKRRLPQTSFQL